ncbi:hypothetical protein EXIGLDRAFT_45672 [Exidia glandulosa HHB12029]|uniref:Uncharacterized protein n=1 Tax=Exidia glandulosa HHB12029 TaxID=1314781 RepID=A0A165III8_EXIGL|nr:hypothetical protein EXIGLDRAFT_45672 [Exidia glandulosa HHB12029]
MVAGNRYDYRVLGATCSRLTLNVRFLALSPTTHLAVLANEQLHTMLRLDGVDGVQVPLTALLKPLVRLGARREAVDAVVPGFFDAVDEANFRFTHESRDELARRWLGDLQALARAGCLIREEIPSLVLAMLFIGLDQRSSYHLNTCVVVAVETVCAAVSSGEDALPLELSICRHIWTWAQSVALPVRARVVELIPGGRTLTRLGRWLAHAFLTGADMTSVDADTYAQPPPLDVLILLLSQTRPPKGGVQEGEHLAPFVVCPETDYNAIRHHVDLLARCLANVREYLTSGSVTAGSDLAEIQPLMKRLTEKLPSGVKGGNVTASAVQQVLTQLHITVCIQVSNIMNKTTGQRQNVLDYIDSPKKQTASAPSPSHDSD